jgi:phospholipase C
MRRFLVAPFFALACGGSLALDGGAEALSARSPIQHLIVVVQENHSFDAYFGTWCTAATGSNPSCTSGTACCEAAPARDPGTFDLPVPLNDITNAAYSPNHTQACENVEMDGGRMDMYVSASCGSPLNFSQASSAVAQYRSWAQQYALADRYFQPVSGASSSNDMYFATARFMFLDNTYEPQAIGAFCSLNRNTIQYTDTTIGDLLNARGVSWAWYAEGYSAMKSALLCPAPPSDCTAPSPYIPCIYDPSDIPAAYFRNSVDNPADMRDLGELATALKKGTLPSVVFVKFLNYHTEHPGFGTTISSGVSHVTQLVNEIEKSKLASSTLVLLTWDESGGYFDHLAPPPPSPVDGQPYGARVPLLALGPLARKGSVSHAVMEHSSIVKFIEWNWLGATGQLGARDAVVNNIGSVVDPAAGVPED